MNSREDSSHITPQETQLPAQKANGGITKTQRRERMDVMSTLRTVFHERNTNIIVIVSKSILTVRADVRKKILS